MFIDDRRGAGARRTVGRWLSILASTGLVLAFLVGFLLWWYAGSRLTPVAIPALDQLPVPTATGTEGPDDQAAAGSTGSSITNTLVVVTESPDEGEPTAESILLVQSGRAQPVVLSFPTDLRIQHAGEGFTTLGEVLPNSGPEALIATMQEFSQLDLDHYVSVDLDAASRLADALGGVRVCLDQPFADENLGLDLAAGCTALDASGADSFVRSNVASEEFGAEEFGRTARRLRLLGGAAEEASALRTIGRPLTIKRVVDTLAADVQTDRDLGLGALRSLAATLAGVDQGDVLLRTVPGTLQTVDGDTYVVAAPEQAPALFDALARGAQLDAEVGTRPAGELGPANVQVLVVNGVGIAGLAGDVQSYLEERNFSIVDALNPGDLDPSDGFDTSLERLTIRYTQATAPHAKVLQDHLGDVPVELQQVQGDSLPKDASVVLVVGSSWNDRS